MRDVKQQVKQYVKKTVIISAMHIEKDGDMVEAVHWIHQSGGKAKLQMDGGKIIYELKIDTLEGTMTGKVGDFIIQGVDGEFYPCKGFIFNKTYDEVLDVVE